MKIGLTAMDVPSIARSARAGFDFIEAKGDILAAAATRELARKELAAAGLPVETLTSPLPRELRHMLVGPQADHRSALSVVMSLVDSLLPLGLELVVFGCSQGRRVPPGFPAEVAEAQLAHIVSRIAEACATHHVRVALEPLAHAETNTLNNVAEALLFSRRLEKVDVGITLDYWQVLQEGLDVGSEVHAAGAALLHVQSADPVTRSLPQPNLKGQLPLLRALNQVGYRGRIAMECPTCDQDLEVMAALARALKAPARSARSSLSPTP